MASPLRVLAFTAHPDDEAWCSGLLAAQVDAGLDVHLAVACNGNMGGMLDRPSDERAEVRKAEMSEAVDVIGCRLHWMGIGDDQLMEQVRENYSELEWRFRDVVRRIDPELLILPHPDEYHHHHRAVHELAYNASLNAGNACHVGDLPPSSGVPITIYTQPLPPAPFQPELHVEVSGTMERKMTALRCHASQHGFLQQQFESDYIRLVERVAEQHGADCGVRYAEAYGLCRAFSRLATTQELARFLPHQSTGA